MCFLHASVIKHEQQLQHLLANLHMPRYLISYQVQNHPYGLSLESMQPYTWLGFPKTASCCPPLHKTAACPRTLRFQAHPSKTPDWMDETTGKKKKKKLNPNKLITGIKGLALLLPHAPHVCFLDSQVSMPSTHSSWPQLPSTAVLMHSLVSMFWCCVGINHACYFSVTTQSLTVTPQKASWAAAQEGPWGSPVTIKIFPKLINLPSLST